MKSSFSRNFFPALLILLLALCAIGFFFQNLAKTVMEEQATERLKSEAEAVSRLASAFYRDENRQTEIFYINLEMAAQVSGADTVICDSEGNLLLCSDKPMGCEHQDLQIEKSFYQQVIKTGYVHNTGIIAGLYTDTRYVVSVPVLDDSGTALGIVISSMPVTASMRVLKSMSRTYLLSCFVAVVLAIAVMSWLVRRHSDPLKEMSQVAVSFGHGDLEARVEVRPNSSREMQELALAFNNMADSLQKGEYRRQEFVANVSHELKTPMTTISGFADGILDGTIPPERQGYYLQMISQETKRLNRLVRSMLDITRLQDGQKIAEEQKTRFDISDCAGQVILTFEQKINKKHLNVEVEMPDYPVYTYAHRDHIIQVLYNLLDNGVKFCPQGGDLRLTVRTGGKKIYVVVGNSGKTIPARELPLVFDRFHKLDKSRSENRDGWGLGLYIVKSIIDAHGENISVSSQNEKTEFTFTLPLVN